jgi:hypothetical protein
MVFNLTHSQIILQYKENGGRIEPYTIVIMSFRQILGMESEILWESEITPTLVYCAFLTHFH